MKSSEQLTHLGVIPSILRHVSVVGDLYVDHTFGRQKQEEEEEGENRLLR